MRLRLLSRAALFALGTSPFTWTAGCGSADDAFSSGSPSDDAGTGGGGGASAGGRANGGGTAGGGASAGGRTNVGGASTGGAGSGTGGGGGANAGGTAGTGNGGAAGAGTGGGDGGVTCPDADSDGQTTCAGDCDDGDPNNFTGNSEYCGDGQDNDCDTPPQAEEGCGGIGTYVSNIGDDNDPGTQAEPVRTIAQGIANAQTIGGNTPVFIAGGHYSEKVTLVEGIDLLGGYLCDSTACTWARDPAVHDSAILNTDAEGLLATDSITRATSVDGLRVQGQDGAGTGRGRAAITLRGGSPTLSNDRINGPNVTSGGFLAGRTMALLILSPSNSTAGPLVQGCTIQGGQSTDGSHGILMESTGAGQGSTYAHIRSNTIRGGQGSGSNALTAWTSGAGTLVEQNDIFAGTATSGSGSSFGIAVGSQMTIDANRINVGAGNAGTCPSGSTALCGGITSFSSTTTITNNVVFGMNAPLSVGIRLMEAEMPAGDVILNGNYVDGGGSSSGGSRSSAVVVQIGSCTGCGFRGYVGRIRNNVLVGGTASERFALYEEAPVGRTQHPQFLENNDLFVAPPLVGNDGLYRWYDGAAATSLTTLAAVNGLAAQIPAVTVGANISADPMVNATFHLRAGSTCANAGTATEAPAADMDGEVRPRGTGIDIGADEAR